MNIGISLAIDVDRFCRARQAFLMRDQRMLVPTRSGEIEIIVTGEALEVLRGGDLPFQDGASLVRYFRSFLAEIALEKLQLSEVQQEPVILTGADVAE